MISGVIEVSRHSLKNMSLAKDLPYNPIVQQVDYCQATGKPQLSTFDRAPKFNIGFVPRTYSSLYEEDLED
jgi:hypothetical protein